MITHRLCSSPHARDSLQTAKRRFPGRFAVSGSARLTRLVAPGSERSVRLAWGRVFAARVAACPLPPGIEMLAAAGSSCPGRGQLSAPLRDSAAEGDGMRFASPDPGVSLAEALSLLRMCAHLTGRGKPAPLSLPGMLRWQLRPPPSAGPVVHPGDPGAFAILQRALGRRGLARECQRRPEPVVTSAGPRTRTRPGQRGLQ